MQTEVLFTLITALVTLVLGFIAKKVPFINNNLIPIQNLVIGLVAAGIFFIMTKDINLAITTAGLLAGGAYDIIHNLQKLLKE